MDEVFQLAMKLSDEDRLRLAEALWVSIGPAGQQPFGAEWIDEAKRRAARIDGDDGRSRSWAEVRERARNNVDQQFFDSLVAQQPRPPLSEVKRQELDRRIADEKANPGDGVRWEEVEAAARERFGR